MLSYLSSHFRNFFNFFISFGVLSLIFLFLAQCKKNSTGNENDKFVFPEKGVSFYKNVEPLFQVRCGLESGCHSPADQPTVNNQLTYTTLTTKALLLDFTLSSTGEKLIDLNIHRKHPELAPLYLILSEGYPKQRQDLMPPIPREPLNQNQLNGILEWIREGCPD
ncbi:hypothetical protein DRI50_08250 [candidate division KSB1 bacterium]|nr:MAG: hypothetical protein DRI50_08250 [candidate division KSB1 bacterium]